MGTNKVNSQKNDNTAQSPETPKEPQIIVIKDTSTRKLFIFIAAMLALVITGYALNVDSFNDYAPPDYLYIHWNDYMKMNEWDESTTDGSPTGNNAKTIHERWSAEYPYRVLLYGRAKNPSGKYTDLAYEYLYVVYSKKPTTDAFTFTYLGDDKGDKSGRIRAFINSSNVGIDKDIMIIEAGNGERADLPVYLSNWGAPTYSVSTGSSGTQGANRYITFDFFYDCASEHQQNANDLSINGLTSISGVPYKYTIHCLDHTGHTSGGSGSSSSGTSGNKWGNGQYGGGIDWGSGGEPSIKDGSSGYNSPSFSSRNDLEYSDLTDWRDYASSGKGDSSKPYSWQDKNNIPDYNFNIPAKPYDVQGWGDTGYSGGTIPDFSNIPTDNNLNFNFNIPTMPNQDKIKFIGIPDDLRIVNTWPPKYPG